MNRMWSPAARRVTVRHSNHRGAVQQRNAVDVRGEGDLRELVAAGEAKRRDNSTCASVSTLTTNRLVASKAARLGDASRSDHSTSGGSRERRERIGGQPDRLSFAIQRGDHRHAGGELAERAAQHARVRRHHTGWRGFGRLAGWHGGILYGIFMKEPPDTAR